MAFTAEAPRIESKFDLAGQLEALIPRGSETVQKWLRHLLDQVNHTPEPTRATDASAIFTYNSADQMSPPGRPYMEQREGFEGSTM
jgi:hypothetical protein